MSEDIKTVRDTLDYLEAITLSLGRGERTARLADARGCLDRVERLATDMERQRDGWQRHAGTSDQEVANLRLAVRTIMEALDIEAVAPELLAVDGANLVLRRIGTIVDEGERGFRERDDAVARAAEMERSLVKHHAAGAMDGVLPGDRCPVCAALSAREEEK